MATITYKCPNCGGGLVFDPATQKFTCEYCLSSFSEKELEETAPDAASDEHVDLHEDPAESGSYTGSQSAGMSGGTHAAQEDSTGAEMHGESSQAAGAGTSAQAQTGQAVLYRCPSCGAEIVTDATTAATFCYYCHNPVVLEGKLSGEYLPDMVIPFKIDREKAVEMVTDFVKKRFFVPRAFWDESQIEKLSGVYYPYWVYSADLEGGTTGRATRIRTWVAGNTRYTETNIFHFERGGSVEVENLTRNALSSSDRNLIDPVMPYRIREAVPFNMSYLQGFVAQRRDIEHMSVSPEMTEQARVLAQNAMKNTVTGYNTVIVEKSDYRIVNEKWQYLLLPVWILTYGASSGKKYYYAMNGQTGETHGRLPINYGKLILWSLIVGIVLFAAALGISYFLL